MAPDLGELYAASRNRITDLIMTAPEGAGYRPCPATPGWSVHDVLAHVRGVAEDVRTGNLDGVATDAWTAAQVQRHHEDSLEELLTCWADDAPLLEGFLSSPQGSAVARAVFDVHCHEADIRGGLDKVVALPETFGAWAMPLITEPWLGSVAAAQAPAIRIETSEGDHLGPSDAPVVLRVRRFDLFRALLGRRSEDQVRAFDWGGADPSPYLDGFFLFGPRESQLVE